MTAQSRLALFVLFMVISSLMMSCTGFRQEPVIATPQKSKVVEIPIVVSPKIKNVIPKGSRIVIANIAGDCAEEVKDALMRRLIDNADYDVLTRDNLEQILVEADRSWAGRFNTETATKLGELLGASLFIVGRVIYCGPSESDSPEDPRGQLAIFATLQILDLDTGKVILSSANEGKYIPRPIPLLYAKPSKEEAQSSATIPAAGDAQPGMPGTQESSKGGFMGAMKRTFAGKGEDQLSQRRRSEAVTIQLKSEQHYAKLRAAEDMANGFANKFFSRPTWDKVEMWTNPYWYYGDSIRYVKLGHCPAAVTLLENTSGQIPSMSDVEVAEYLHNFGVALLCANEPELAMHKLRSAYRIANSPATLKMLGLAAKIMEWSLNVDVDVQPEVDLILERNMHRPAATAASSPRE